MYKLIVFDLDGTLAEAGCGTLPENLAMLRELEKRGMRIAICSGKPTYYLCGFMRQVGLAAPILVGENGAVIQFGVDLPPKAYHVLPYSDAAKHSMRLMRDAIDSMIPDMWYQPNQTALTPFPKNEREFDRIQDCIDTLKPQLKDITIRPSPPYTGTLAALNSSPPVPQRKAGFAVSVSCFIFFRTRPLPSAMA